MTKQEQDRELVDAESEPTAELEMLPESVLDATDSHPIPDDRFESDPIEAAGTESAGADDDRTVPGSASGDTSLVDALGSLRSEVDLVRALTESLDRDVQDGQGVTTVLAKDLEAIRMKQAATEELLGLCRSEIEKLKTQIAMSQQDAAPMADDAGPETNRSQQDSPQIMPGSGQRPALAGVPEAGADESPAVAESSNAKRAQVVPFDDFAAAPVPERLLVVRNCSTSKSYPLDEGNVRLGSSPDNDIQLGSSYVSRHHAEFVSSRAGCVLKDLDSTNGIYVNSRRIKRCALHNGDWIAIGKYRFEFVEQH